MKKTILGFSIGLLLCSCNSGDSFEIGKEKMMDKIMGAWAGQAIGCTYGGPTEFHYQGRIIDDSIHIDWPDGHMKWYYDNASGLYDDLYMDLTFVEVFHKEGLDAPINSFAEAYANAGYSLWHANQAGRYNIKRGIMPPESGYWENNPHADDIDYQIEADYAGIMCPAMPNTASEISDKIGHIMNYGDGWYGGVFVGAMYSLAYKYENVMDVVEMSLQTIPAESKFRQCMDDVVAWYKENPTDWKQAWQKVQDKWSDEIGCPDGVKSDFDIDALINSAYIVIGLLYGEGDFGKTLDISTRCGQDSDCNPASAAGILGCMIGYSNIPEEWKKNLYEVEDRDFDFTTISLKKAYQYSMEAASELIVRNGGKDLGDSFRIKEQKPLAVRFEESFAGLVAKEVRGGRPVPEFGEEEFTGKGIVVSGYTKSEDPNYVAEVEVYVDAELRETMKCPTNFHDRTTEICWMYDLEEGPHKLSLKWLNPVEGAELNSTRIIIYGSK